jgi:hypothetical protein
VCCAVLVPRVDAVVPERAPIRDPSHQFSLEIRNYVQIKNQNIVMQRRDYSCGAATLATIARYYWGDNVTEDDVLRALDEILTPEQVKDRIENGLSMTDLRRAAVKMGYQAIAGKLSFYKLQDAKVPVIVGISPGGHDHFVVYRGTDGAWVYLADPIRGNIRMPIREFTDQWQKNAVLAIHKPGQKVRETSPLSVRWDEVIRGELNWQWIRTQQDPGPTRRPQVP